MMVRIGCIVEGIGEEQAVPILIRRVAATLDPSLAVEIPRPLRQSRSKLVKSGELERHVGLLARKLGSAGSIFIMIDSDDDCPRELGPELLRRAVAARSDLSFGLVLAEREFRGLVHRLGVLVAGHPGPSPRHPTSPES